MGGKSSQSTQTVSIPPEILARYNAVNARAETTAQTPFQQYSTNPADFVAPLTSSQQAGIANTNYYAGTAQPYYQAATGQLAEAQQAAVPYYGQATQNVGQAQAVGSNLAGSSLDALAGAFGASSPYYAQANQNIGGAQNAGNMLAYGSLGALGGASAAANPLQQQAQAGLAGAYAGAQPFNMAAAGQYMSGLQQGQDLSQQAYGSGQQALRGAQPFQGMASQYMQSGAQAVNPGALGAEQINQYMSPYLSNVLQGTAALQNQMNQQAMSGQTGNAIRSGAFGGDRAGIAAANLAQQQQIANSKIFSDILNQGYGQALGTAQQQQQLGLSAEQANRAALQQAAQQALGIGQQGFGQGMAAAQQQQQLAQQLYGMGSGAGQNLAALGQQVYGQGANTAQQQAALANQLFGQGATTAQQMAQLGQQQFGQGMTAAQQQAQMGQQMFGQGSTAAQQLAALGQQQYGQGMGAAQQNAALAQGIYGMGANTAQNLAAFGQGAQGAGLQGAQAQIAAGLGQQQTEQAGLQALYNQFLQQQSYPFQTAQFLANIAMGTGALSGSTTQTNQAGGGFSDRRLKENIREVGKTFDGQTIYSYNFKGSPKTEIGLMAQEVEKKHPEAVGLAGGYKTVRYDKATDAAADRGHFAYGGSAMGGGVMPQHAGEGFYDGGYVGGFDPGLMQQILASYQQMYAPMGAGQSAGGLGAAGFVPAANLPVGSLMTAGELPAMRSATENAANMVSLGKGIGELGGKVGAWKWGDEEKEKDPDRKDLPKEFSDGEWRRGGRAGLAGGGVPTELSIPNEREKIEPLKPADAPERPKDNTADMLKLAAKIAMAAKSGGRIGYAVGGTPYGNDGGYLSGVLEEQNKQKAPELMKPGSLPGQGPGFLDTAAKGAGLVNSVLGIGKKLGLKFADGGLAGGNNDDQGPDFNLDPEDLIAGEDQEFEAFLRSSSNKNEPQAKGIEAIIPEQAAETKPVQLAYKSTPKGLGAAPRIAPTALTGDLGAITRMIHGQEGTGKNPRSSAVGPYQMIDSTFVGYFRKMYPGQSQGKSDSEILSIRRTPAGIAISEKMGPQIIRDNARIIAESGFEPNARNVYLAHFFGPKTAVKVLRANPNTPIEQIVGSDAVDSNPFLRNKSAMGVIEFAHNAMAKQQRRLLSGKSEGGLIGRHGYALDGSVPSDPEEENKKAAGLVPEETPAPVVEEEKKPVGLAAAAAAPPPAATPSTAAPVAQAAPTETGLAAPAREAPKNLLQELPQRGITYGRGTEQKPAFFGGSNIPGYNVDYMTEPFFKGLKKGTASSWIPLLTGLGTFATTPTRSVLSGLLAGAGAGAQTYASLANERNKQLPVRRAAASKEMEITKGILEKRYEFLENGFVRDTYTDTFLPAKDATIAREKAFAAGPLEALRGTNVTAMSRQDYERLHPTAGTVVPKLPVSHSFEVNPNNPEETIRAAGELNPGVMAARADRDKAEYVMNDLKKQLGSPGVGAERYTQLYNLYQLAKADYDRANTKWENTLNSVTGVAIDALKTGNAARINLNAQALAPLIDEARAAILTKATIQDLRKSLGEGGPLSRISSQLGQGLIQLGVDPNLVENFIRAPDSTQTQNGLAEQLRLLGSDPEATAALKAYGSANFSKAAVAAILRNAERKADSQISSFQAANNSFQLNPLGGDVGGTGTRTLDETRNAKMYATHPQAGALPKGTPYKVAGDPKTYYAK